MGSKITPETIRKIKDAVNIVDIVSEHVVLKKSGSQLGGLCPFHSERTPSFSVSEAKQLYYCYGCHAGGDSINFLKEIHGLSFTEAVQDLAERAGIQLSINPNAHGEQKKNQTAFRLNRFAASFFRNQLTQNVEAKNYLTQRGIVDEKCSDFYLGFAPNQWEALYEYLKNAKAPMDVAETLGLIRKSQKNAGEYFDLFRNRVIFPILDLRGKVIAFGGRTLEGSPKYLNSSDSFLFHKSKALYGIYQARKYIKKSNEVILVEGFFDVLAMHQVGIQNVVATCGTALTLEHISTLSRFAERIVLLFDGDQAGKNAMRKGMEIGLSAAKILNGVFLPEGKDPDELIQSEGVESMKKLVQSSKPLIDALIESKHDQWSKIADPSQKTQELSSILKDIGPWIEKMPEAVDRMLRAERIRQIFSVHPSVIRAAVRNLPQGSASVKNNREYSFQSRRREFRQTSRSAKPATSEKTLLLGLIQWKKFQGKWQKIGGNLPPGLEISSLFGHPELQKWTKLVFENRKWADGPDLKLGQEALGGELDWDLEIKSLIIRGFLEQEELSIEENIEAAMKQRLKAAWAQFSQEIKMSAARAAALDEKAEEDRLMEEFLDVQRKINDFRTPNG